LAAVAPYCALPFIWGEFVIEIPGTKDDPAFKQGKLVRYRDGTLDDAQLQEFAAAELTPWMSHRPAPPGDDGRNPRDLAKAGYRVARVRIRVVLADRARTAGATAGRARSGGELLLLAILQGREGWGGGAIVKLACYR
jgi:hypothetical protein